MNDHWIVINSMHDIQAPRPHPDPALLEFVDWKHTEETLLPCFARRHNIPIDVLRDFCLRLYLEAEWLMRQQNCTLQQAHAVIFEKEPLLLKIWQKAFPQP